MQRLSRQLGKACFLHFKGEQTETWKRDISFNPSSSKLKMCIPPVIKWENAQTCISCGFPALISSVLQAARGKELDALRGKATSTVFFCLFHFACLSSDR